MVFGILIGTGFFYLIFADGKTQPWNNPNALKNKSEDSEIEMSREAKETFIKNF
jgi:hypothetical protein